jgi:glycosyltransferase involved in cell wall biosynthesis
MVRGDAVIANSEWTAGHIRSTYDNRAKRLTVIPRGLDLSQFDPANVAPERVTAMRDSWQAKQGDRIVLLPGRLTRWKGQLVFLRALAKLKRAGRLPGDVRAVIAGSAQGRTDYAREILDAVARDGLADVVVVCDHVTDMPAAYLAADIVVSASTDPEAFGRVPPEAAAMGRPVIATDHGGTRETVLPRESGLLVEPKSATSLSEALLDLLHRPPAELDLMGRKGRAHIAAHYTVERMCADTLELYSALIEETVKLAYG